MFKTHDYLRPEHQLALCHYHLSQIAAEKLHNCAVSCIHDGDISFPFAAQVF